MTILDALADPSLLGAMPCFRDLTTWAPWLAFLKAFYGLPMDEADLELFRRHTGRSGPRDGGYAEGVLIVGVQSGKTQIASAVGCFEAMQAAVRGARGLYVPLLAQDLRGAQRALFGYVREAFEAPMLRDAVSRENANVLELTGGVALGVYPCRPAAVRGIRAAAVVIDELAFFTATDGRPTDTEMLRVARGRVATTGGKVLILSSPYGASGALHDLHRQNFGRDASSTLVWQAASNVMNPTLPLDYLKRMEESNPDAYRSEVLGEFRAGISTLLDPGALADCVVTGERERAPLTGRKYLAHTDSASGSITAKDNWTLGIGHLEGDKAVLDVCRAWRPPFSPAAVAAEASGLLRHYGLVHVAGDRYAPNFVTEAFLAHGVTYAYSERDRSEIYLDFVGLVNQGSVSLLDDVDLLRELRGLERRRGTSGRDRVDHRPGQHDDRALAAAGVLTRLLKRAQPAIAVLKVGGEWIVAGKSDNDDALRLNQMARRSKQPGGGYSDGRGRGGFDSAAAPRWTHADSALVRMKAERQAADAARQAELEKDFPSPPPERRPFIPIK